jgi:addiction module RelE/StbE family toxin
MSYEIVLEKRAEKELRKLDKVPRTMLCNKINELSEDPLKHGELEGCRYRRVRSGDYRAIYTISGNQVRILKIGHRENVYKRL